MKTVVNSDGEFVCTFEGGEIDLNDPALKGCSVVGGDAPLKALQAKMERESDAAAAIAKGERDEEHKHLHDLEERLIKLESLINSTG